MRSRYWGSFGGTPNLPNLKNQVKYQSAFSYQNEDSFQLHSTSPISEIDHLVINTHGEFFGDGDEVFSSHSSDSNFIHQKVFKAYQEKGRDFTKTWDGLFFIIIYDKQRKCLCLFNNRYQCTNGYYTTKAPFLFSSELMDIKNNLPKVEPHFGSIRAFISNGFTIPDQTQIKGIKKILPHFNVEISQEDLNLQHHLEDEYIFERRPFEDLDKKLNEYESIYRKGLENWIEAAKVQECGSLLSGGHDTSFAFIQASKMMNKPIHGFTVTFPGWAWDEGDFAKNICEKFKGQFHPILFLPEDLDLIVSMVRGNQEPVVGSSLPLHKLSREAHQHVDGLIGGDGGDTLWGEYFPVAEYHRYIKNLPLKMRKIFSQFAKVAVKLTDWERFWELQHVSELFVRENYYDNFMGELCTYRHFSPEFQKELFKEEIYRTTLPRPSYEVPFTKENFRDALISGKLYNAFYTYQSFSTTRSVEHFGVNFYLPTINKDLINFINQLPYEWVNGGTTFHRLTNNKTINRRFHKIALSRYLKKEEIYNRSFDIPWYKILRPREAVLEKLLERLKKRGWYNEAFLENLFEEFKAQRVKDYELLELKHHGYRIFTLLSLEVWCMEFLDGLESKNFDNGINLEEYLDS